MGQLLVLIAPSGSGKSTAAQYLKTYYQAEIVKLATPLYQMQGEIYKKLNLPVTGQDGELLQFLGKKVFKLSPDFLFNEFKKVYNPQVLTVNDDCRPHNYDNLKSLGAVFVEVVSPVRTRKEDVTDHNHTDELEWQRPTPAQYQLNNEGSLEEFYHNIDKLMEKLCYPKKSI